MYTYTITLPFNNEGSSTYKLASLVVVFYLANVYVSHFVHSTAPGPVNILLVYYDFLPRQFRVFLLSVITDKLADKTSSAFPKKKKKSREEI